MPPIPIALLIGPEGGWTDAESAAARFRMAARLARTADPARRNRRDRRRRNAHACMVGVSARMKSVGKLSCTLRSIF